jgi:hypothetical protein
MRARGEIYRELLTRPRFHTEWQEQRRFNAKAGDFHYVVFRRLEESDKPGDALNSPPTEQPQ